MAAQDVDFGADRIQITAHEQRKCIYSVLRQIVNHRGRPGAHALYVSQVGMIQGEPFIRVYWPRDHSILVISLVGLPCDSPGFKMDDGSLYWYDMKGRVDLRTGLVPTRDDIGSSTYLVDKPWADAVIADCVQNGCRVRFKRLSGSK